ncbi:unnamed protein product [Didymodactylos carnosus]|uniref:Uncharacterized protein n=1 Tax=Didymodactylos carnosus TaxID=1234261 RepID=A0A815H339_9BILA|nr:unnamed protein product [Didymodactylos carnosus]CAF1354264.1 unnamed protein product [Didymodactylos carnosus]CAF4164662.1 unnamed protein product [Didymodactylos carnosus]CAF4212702.1 unnamed protein product [Didymodactylos carnosus]
MFLISVARFISQFSRWEFTRPEWLTKNVLIVCGIIAGIAIIAAIVIPVAVIFSKRKHLTSKEIVCHIIFSKTVDSVAATTNTTTDAPVLAYWNFEGNGNDLYGVYNGTSNCGSCQYLTTGFYGGTYFYIPNTNNYMQVPASSYFNLNSRSFTFEAWVYFYSLSTDQPIFSQCTCTTCTSQCLFLVVRSSKLYMGFNFNDLSGSTTLSTYTWYHVAFVYNYQTFQQIIYLEGVQDAIRSSVTPYLGTNGSMYFGALPNLISTYYYGIIDNAQLTTRAKSSTEISNDAMQVFYYSFDQPNPYYDNGPNRLNATATNILSATTGHVGQAVRFTSTSSYLQICCFTGVGWPSSRSLSFAMWISPSSINGGNFVYSTQGYPMLGLTYSGQIAAQILEQAPVNVWETIYGTFAVVNTWVHVACTFSVTNGFILYVNGVSQGAITGISTYYFNYNFQTIQMGTGNGNGYIPSYGFQGSIDEFYTYRRELSATEILALASV